jgi:hypothetical protein
MRMTKFFATKTRALVCTAVAAALTGCGGERRSDVVASGQAPAECRSREGGSRWASSHGGYVEAGVLGRDPQQWVEEVAGVVELGGLIYVYDPGRAHIVVLDEAFRPVRTFGREGKGPGEIEPERDMGTRGPGWKWMELVDSSLVVFDGFRLQVFAPDGSLRTGRLQTPLRRGWVNFWADRVRISSDAIISSNGGYDFGSRSRRPNEWTIDRSTESATTPILSLQLPPLPRSRGVPFGGPDQALPVWDAASGCVVASDGTGRWVVRSSVTGRRIDTLALNLPDLPRPKVNVAELERLLGAAHGGGGYVGPTARQDVDAIAIDPDGYAWILPTQDTAARGSGVVVVRLSLQTGAATQDTVPAFPTAFGSPGMYYARVGGRVEPALIRYRLRAGGAP